MCRCPGKKSDFVGNLVIGQVANNIFTGHDADKDTCIVDNRDEVLGHALADQLVNGSGDMYRRVFIL